MFIGVWGAACGDEDVRALECYFPVGLGEVQSDGFAGGAFDAREAGVGDDLDAFVLEELLEAFDDVGVFVVGDAGVAFDDGDACAETADGLG